MTPKGRTNPILCPYEPREDCFNCIHYYEEGTTCKVLPVRGRGFFSCEKYARIGVYHSTVIWTIRHGYQRRNKE